MSSPAFSFGTVPTMLFCGTHGGTPFSTSEENAIAAQYQTMVVIIHNGDGSVDGIEYYEDQVNALAGRLKAKVPTMTVIFYGGFHGQKEDNIGSGNGNYWYWTLPELLPTTFGGQGNPAWVGGKGANAQDAAFRAAWSTDFAQVLTRCPNIDGLLVDSVGNYDPNIHDMLTQLKSKMPSGKLLLANTKPDLTSGASYFDVLDGSYWESYINNGTTGKTAAQLAADLVQCAQYTATGGIFTLRAWPGFSNVGGTTPSPYSRAQQVARQNIAFGLGCYLVIAGTQSRFSFGWGYGNSGGAIPLKSDSSGNIINPYTADSPYVEFSHTFGQPLGTYYHPAVNTGSGKGLFLVGSGQVVQDIPTPNPLIFLRDFTGGTVVVNLYNMTAYWGVGGSFAAGAIADGYFDPATTYTGSFVPTPQYGGNFIYSD